MWNWKSNNGIKKIESIENYIQQFFEVSRSDLTEDLVKSWLPITPDKIGNTVKIFFFENKGNNELSVVIRYLKSVQQSISQQRNNKIENKIKEILNYPL